MIQLDRKKIQQELLWFIVMSSLSQSDWGLG